MRRTPSRPVGGRHLRKSDSAQTRGCRSQTWQSHPQRVPGTAGDRSKAACSLLDCFPPNDFSFATLQLTVRSQPYLVADAGEPRVCSHSAFPGRKAADKVCDQNLKNSALLSQPIKTYLSLFFSWRKRLPMALLMACHQEHGSDTGLQIERGL